jgi:SAM-dependent methyltransferase
MIQVKTEHPIAINSLDYLYPEGVFWDNNLSMNFLSQLENHYNNRKINFLDLGCAGGALSVAMHERGHKSIGIDGSDGCLNVRPEVIEHYNGMPLGHDNWVKYNNTVLFTADITKEYEIIEDSKLVEFDTITCWDVMEHFDPDTVDTFLKQVHKHLKVGGMFMASIAMLPAGAHTEWQQHPNIEYHKSLFNRDWWMEKLLKYFVVNKLPLTVCNREYIDINKSWDSSNVNFVFAATKM